MINGQCVARTDIRQARRAARREGYGVGGRLYVAPVATAVGVAAGLGAGLLGAGPLGLGQAYYTEPHYSPYEDYTTNSSDWYAVRAYYAGGPWYYGSNGWGDYAARAGIACTPGSIINGADGIRYVCQ